MLIGLFFSIQFSYDLRDTWQQMVACLRLPEQNDCCPGNLSVYRKFCPIKKGRCIPACYFFRHKSRPALRFEFLPGRRKGVIIQIIDAGIPADLSSPVVIDLLVANLLDFMQIQGT